MRFFIKIIKNVKKVFYIYVQQCTAAPVRCSWQGICLLVASARVNQNIWIYNFIITTFD